jgi:hypothetical protein
MRDSFEESNLKLEHLLKRRASQKSGSYTPSVTTNVSGINTMVVDPHNEVVLQWYKVKNEGKPAVLIHVDAHDDMDDGAQAFDVNNKENIFSKEFHVRNNLNIANFISFAVNQKLVNVAYHVNLRYENIDSYGHVIGDKIMKGLETEVKDNGRIIWSSLFNPPIYRKFMKPDEIK